MSDHTHFPIPDDWIEKCHQDKDWCENFLSMVNDNGEPSLSGLALAPWCALILLIGAFVVYWFFFRNKSETGDRAKETKSQGDKIDSHKSDTKIDSNFTQMKLKNLGTIATV